MSDKAQQELDSLKARADTLGIKYSNQIGADTLRQRIREHTEALENPEPKSNTRTGNTNAHQDREMLLAKARMEIQKEATKLIRVRLTNMNTKKKDLPGEIITVANEYYGTVSKFIPFDPAFYENGYHIPNVIYKNLRNKKFLNIRHIKDPRTGRTRISESWVREYAIEVLPPLTPKELKELAQTQAASGSIDTETLQ